MARALKVGVLELVASTEVSAWAWLPGFAPFARQVPSIMPQAVSVWARQMGHRVTYAAWCGRADPIDLLPDDLDFVFIATGSQGSALAYALARLYRQRRVRTVIAGPHAAAFPRDCARFFDVTVPRCDRALLAEILSLDPRPGTILTSTRPPADAPCIEERLPELEASVLARGRRGIATVIPLRATSHWPSDGDTSGCRPAATLAADLTFVAKAFPGAVLGFQDEDFGLHLDETLDRLEAVPPARRSRYLVQCSLDALTTERRRRLATTGCLHLTAGMHGRDRSPVAERASRLVEGLAALRHHVPGLEANIVLGHDDEAGEEAFAAARSVLHHAPFAWPAMEVITPWGGTALYRTVMGEGRLLEAMPLALYGTPCLAMVLRHVEAAEFYDRAVALMEEVVALPATLRHLTQGGPAAVRLARGCQVMAARRIAAEMRHLRDLLHDDTSMRAFHAGRRGDLPAYYVRRLAQRLGRYRELLAPTDLRPLHGEPILLVHGEPILLAPRRPARPMRVAQAAE